MFQLSKTEFQIWKSQIVTSNSDKMGLRRPPYAFTEQGVAMLSGILNSDIAIDTNIKIIRAFVAIANRIYEILEAKKMTQKDLAMRLGKTETEVSRWLSGTHNLTLSTICKISAALEEEIVQVVHSHS